MLILIEGAFERTSVAEAITIDTSITADQAATPLQAVPG